jgi:hypothetical protein
MLNQMKKYLFVRLSMSKACSYITHNRAKINLTIIGETHSILEPWTINKRIPVSSKDNTNINRNIYSN